MHPPDTSAQYTVAATERRVLQQDACHCHWCSGPARGGIPTGAVGTPYLEVDIRMDHMAAHKKGMPRIGEREDATC
eukprot:scaffold154691_cov31-Tisochrysis_lutea.AAC.2